MIKYRADIDGLRALAVLLVLLFHVGISGVSGGFVGVDIFFVISGYLITAIITRDIEQGRFSLIEFYERRLRRILPAFFAVAIFTLIISTLCFMPDDFSKFGKSLFGTSVYASNIIFWREAGYFDASKWVKPLLHTWSLSVEEQFYLIFPLAILIIQRFFKNWLRPLIILGLFTSLAMSIFCVMLDKQAFAFYMLPSRAWELLIGSAIALKIYPQFKNKTALNIASIAGLVLMLGAGFMLSEAHGFPGANALYPTLGAALFIYTGHMSAQKSWGNALLTFPAFVGIGKISYSLYLWHWPLIIFARYILDRALFMPEKIMIIGASFLLAYLSWRLIEQPFRHKNIWAGRKAFFLVCLIFSLALAAIGIAIKENDGYASRFGKPLEVVSYAATQHNPLREHCYHRGTFPSEGTLDKCFIGALDTAEVSVIIIGDSHADSFTPLISALLKQRGLKGIEITSTACPPLLGAEIDVMGAIFQNQSKGKFKKCHGFNRALYKYIADHQNIKTVILSARWGYYTQNVSINESEPDQNIFLYDALDNSLSTENSQRTFARTLDSSLEFLRNIQRNVLIIGPVPEATQNIPNCMSKHIVLRKPPCKKITLSEVLARQHFVLDSFKAKQSEGVFTFFPHITQCKNDICITAKEGDPLYYDDDHLSINGALYFKDALDTFLQQHHIFEEYK